MADRAQLLVGLLADLAAEGAALDAVLADLEDTAWLGPTPAEGWTVAHQIAHLAWTDEQALLAATDPEAFTAAAAEAAARVATLVDDAAATGAAQDPERLLARWRAGRTQLAERLAALPDGAKLPWFGPPMSAASMATARLMETWAHGQDVTDALGLRRGFTPRLRHVAFLGHRTLGHAFAMHGLPVPERPVRVELATPDGDLWTWGPEGAENLVRGPALDFCLLATRLPDGHPAHADAHRRDRQGRRGQAAASGARDPGGHPAVGPGATQHRRQLAVREHR